MRWGRPGWTSEMMAEPGTRGFLWGVGAAMAAMFLWPAIREAARPAAKGAIRGAMAAGDRFRYAVATAREGLEDVIAEAQFERMRAAADPGGAGDGMLDPAPVEPGAADPERDH